LDWHRRYQQQAAWTYQLRQHLYNRYKIPSVERLLDVGCGTGILLEELAKRGQAGLYGIDVNSLNLNMAIRNTRGLFLSSSDAHQLPFKASAFDVCICHFVLLWLLEPGQALAEMKRVTRPNGMIIALAEPDYGTRLDYPDELSILGVWQSEALQRQGADPLMGRKVAHLFHQAGLTQIESGILGANWTGGVDIELHNQEWQVLFEDLEHQPEKLAEAIKLRNIDRQASQEGWRVLFVPTFFAAGRVPPA
jgi:ubiquinone/menaquinone biosynthesis C-methylase UbiE